MKLKRLVPNLYKWFLSYLTTTFKGASQRKCNKGFRFKEWYSIIFYFFCLSLQFSLFYLAEQQILFPKVIQRMCWCCIRKEANCQWPKAEVRWNDNTVATPHHSSLTVVEKDNIPRSNIPVIMNKHLIFLWCILVHIYIFLKCCFTIKSLQRRT